MNLLAEGGLLVLADRSRSTFAKKWEVRCLFFIISFKKHILLVAKTPVDHDRIPAMTTVAR